MAKIAICKSTNHPNRPYLQSSTLKTDGDNVLTDRMTDCLVTYEPDYLCCFRDVAALHYDPSREDHKHFELDKPATKDDEESEEELAGKTRCVGLLIYLLICLL